MVEENLDSKSYFSEIVEDKRFIKAFKLFNSCEWYEAHDLLEEIWHETYGPERQCLQAIIQISVAQLHLENGNNNGAIMLYGEALGRLKRQGTPSLGLDIDSLCLNVQHRLRCLQYGNDPTKHKDPFLSFKK